MTANETDRVFSTGKPLADYVNLTTRLARPEFLMRQRAPLLIVEVVEEEGEASLQNFATMRLTDPGESRKGDTADLADRIREALPNVSVLSVEKRNSDFASIVTLGRAPKSDLLVNLASVSKFHCYFTHKAREGAWYISDANAANGTYLDGLRLEANDKKKLQSGSAVRFGLHIRGRFFEPGDFYDYLKTLQGNAGPPS